MVSLTVIEEANRKTLNQTTLCGLRKIISFPPKELISAHHIKCIIFVLFTLKSDMAKCALSSMCFLNAETDCGSGMLLHLTEGPARLNAEY